MPDALITGAIVLLLILTNIDRYARLFGLIGKRAASPKYTVFGIGMSAVGYGLYIGCNIVAKAGSGIDPIWVVEAVGLYVALTAIGWVGEKTVKRMRSMHVSYLNREHPANTD